LSTFLAGIKILKMKMAGRLTEDAGQLGLDEQNDRGVLVADRYDGELLRKVEPEANEPLAFSVAPEEGSPQEELADFPFGVRAAPHETLGERADCRALGELVRRE
jgi:hypothetical protein